MRITVLTSVDKNPDYLACAELYVNFWLSQSNEDGHTYHPLIVVVADELPSSLHLVEDYCLLFNPLSDVSTVFTSQLIRVLYASLIRSDYVVTSDIDLLPLDVRVFSSVLSLAPSAHEAFHVCRDVLEDGQIAICYNMATPRVWSRVSGIQRVADTQRVLRKEFTNASDRNLGYEQVRGGKGWFSDQEFLFARVHQFQRRGGRVLKYLDKDTGFRRLDRVFSPFPANWALLPLVFLGIFSDYNVHRPVGRYKNYIFAVLSLVKLRNGIQGKYRKWRTRSSG